MLVSTNLPTVIHAGLINELSVLGTDLRARFVLLIGCVGGLESENELLNHMVPVRVQSELHTEARHLLTHQEKLIMHLSGVLPGHFDEGLNSARTVHVDCDVDHMGSHGRHELLQRVDRGRLNEPLDEVVAKLVGHDVGHDLESEEVEDYATGQWAALMDCAGRLKELGEPLLDHPAASLIEGKLINLLADVELLAIELHSQPLW